MSTMALHHQASASSPAETEPFAGLHSDGISICDVGMGWWAIRRKDVHFATVCQVLSDVGLRDDTYLGGQLVGGMHILPCAKFGVLEGRNSATWSFNQPFGYQVTRSKYDE